MRTIQSMWRAPPEKCRPCLTFWRPCAVEGVPCLTCRSPPSKNPGSATAANAPSEAESWLIIVIQYLSSSWNKLRYELKHKPHGGFHERLRHGTWSYKQPNAKFVKCAPWNTMNETYVLVSVSEPEAVPAQCDQRWQYDSTSIFQGSSRLQPTYFIVSYYLCTNTTLSNNEVSLKYRVCYVGPYAVKKKILSGKSPIGTAFSKTRFQNCFIICWHVGAPRGTDAYTLFQP